MSKKWWLAIGGILIGCLLAGACAIVALAFTSVGGSLSDLLPGPKTGVYLVLEGDTSRLPEGERARTLEAAMAVIQRRAKEYGVSRPVIKRDGNNRVTVWLPGANDADAAANLMSKPGLLEFMEQLSGKPDPWAPAQGTVNGKPTALTGQHIRHASLAFDENGHRQLDIELTPDGKALFAQVTSRNVGKPLAIFVDRKLVVAPVVQEPITNGVLRITGTFTQEEARVLAAQLNGGALPLPFTVVETGSTPN